MRATLLQPSLLVLGLAAAACGGGAEEAPAAGAAAVAAARTTTPCASAPATLAAPAGNELDFYLDAQGVQIYDCKDGGTGPAWVFRAPQATLLDRRGAFAGTHYAGPTWESKDGSKVVGVRLAGATVDPTAIPWLLLGAASHAGDGRMDEVTYVQRVLTVGGLAPAGPCTAGASASVPYTATYCFYEAK